MSLAGSDPPWGWTVPARAVLAMVAAIGGTWLLRSAPGDDGPEAAPPRLVVDLNTAPAGVLAALPKLGPSLVGRIVEARAEAPFRSLEDLDARVRGIGPATIAALRPHLRIEATTPRGPSPRAGESGPTTAATRDGR